MKKLTFIFIAIFTYGITNAQTLYESKKGFYSSVIPNFSYEKTIFDRRTIMIAPNLGYRINKNYDVLFFLGFLNHKRSFVESESQRIRAGFTNMNIGFILGQTLLLNKSKYLGIRNELGFAESFNITDDERFRIGDLSATGVFISSSIFKRFSLFKNWFVYPKGGLMMSLNSYNNPYISDDHLPLIREENNLFITTNLDIQIPSFGKSLLILGPTFKYSAINNDNSHTTDRTEVGVNFVFNF